MPRSPECLEHRRRERLKQLQERLCLADDHHRIPEAALLVELTCRERIGFLHKPGNFIDPFYVMVDDVLVCDNPAIPPLGLLRFDSQEHDRLRIAADKLGGESDIVHETSLIQHEMVRWEETYRPSWIPAIDVEERVEDAGAGFASERLNDDGPFRPVRELTLGEANMRLADD